MARMAGGKDQLAMAREAIRTAKTADELRAAQAVVLPLELGLSIAQTAIAIGRSVELREKHFHNRVFDSIDALEDHLVDALKVMEHNTERVASITRWPWIINVVSNAN